MVNHPQDLFPLCNETSSRPIYARAHLIVGPASLHRRKSHPGSARQTLVAKQYLAHKQQMMSWIQSCHNLWTTCNPCCLPHTQNTCMANHPQDLFPLRIEQSSPPIWECPKGGPNRRFRLDDVHPKRRRCNTLPLSAQQTLLARYRAADKPPLFYPS